MPKLFIEKLCDTPTPMYQTDYAVGMDIHAVIPEGSSAGHISPGMTNIIQTGLKIQPSEGYGVFLYPRSGLAAKLNINLTNCVGVIDRDYKDELRVLLHNAGNDHVIIRDGERICQMEVRAVDQAEVIVVDELPSIDSNRTGGFGSTGT